MTSVQLREAHRAQPFPLHLADGREFPIDAPEYLAVLPNGRSIVVSQREDAFNIIEVSQVKSLEFENEPGKEANMPIEQLRAAYQAQPFQPFVLHLADGRQLAVASPEFMTMAPSGRTIIVYQPDDSFNVVDLLLVTDLEFKPARNGAGRRRRK